MKSISCGSCLYFSPGLPSTNPARLAQRGQCRRSSPIVDMLDGRPVTLWPITLENQFCGEHEEGRA